VDVALDALAAAKRELDAHARESRAVAPGSYLASASLVRLEQVTAALTDTATHQTVADTVLREAALVLECDAGNLSIATEDRGQVLIGAFGDPDPYMSAYAGAAPTVGAPFLDTMERGVPIYVESIDEMFARFPSFAGMDRKGDRQAWMFLPLQVGDASVGGLAFGFDRRRSFGAVDRQIAFAVSRYCAHAVDGLRLRAATQAALAVERGAEVVAAAERDSHAQLLNTLSHELRTPLNAIIGYADIIALGIRGPVTEGQRADLARIKRAGGYLLKIVQDVLTVARLERASLPLTVGAVRVHVALMNSIELCALQAEGKRISLTVELRDRDASVVGSAQSVQQILLNLLGNAIKFTAPGGSVTVSCETVESSVRFDVADTGCGIAASDFDRIFEPFVQIDPQLTAAAEQGAGLGLSISRDLARAMHGDLTLRSARGIGSVFTLTLPIAPTSDSSVGGTMWMPRT
jgi:signal transduction histidine kinase